MTKFPPLKNSSRLAPQHDSEASVFRVTDGVGGGDVETTGKILIKNVPFEMGLDERVDRNWFG